MASNINVAITADATQLRAQLAVAQQNLRDYSAQLRQAAADARTSSAATAEQVQALDKAASSYNVAAAQVAALRNALNDGSSAARAASQGLTQTAGAAEHAAQGSSAVTRELIVMGHEAMQGRFSRIPGSMMVLAEHTGVVTTVMSSMTGGMWAAAAAAGALIVALGSLVLREYEVASAIRAASTAAVEQGRSGPQAQAAVTNFASSLRETGLVGKVAATQIGASLQMIPGMVDEQRQKVDQISKFFFVQLGNNAEETSKKLDSIFRTPSALEKYLTEQGYMVGKTAEQWATATTATEKYDIGIAAMNARLSTTVKAYEDLNKQVAQNAQEQAALGEFGGPPGSAGQVAMPPGGLGAFEPGTTRATAEQEAQTQAVLKGSQAVTERIQLEHDLALAQQARAQAGAQGDELGARMADAAVAKYQDALNNLHAPGDAGPMEKIAAGEQLAAEKAVIAAQAAGEKGKQIAEAEAKAKLGYLQQVLTTATLNEEQRTHLEAEQAQLRISLAREETSGKTGNAAAAERKTVEQVVAGYDEQIAAARGNLAAIEAIETQKMAFLASHYAQNSTEYQRALREEQAQLREALQSEVSDIKEAGTQEIEDRKAELDLAVAQHRTSKEQEARDELAFDDQVHASQLRQLDDLIGSLQAGTSAYTAALKDRHNLDVQFQLQHEQMLTKLQEDENAAAQKDMRIWTEAYNSIGSEAASSVAELITGKSSYLAVEQRIASSVIELGVKELGRFLAIQAAKTAASWVSADAQVAAAQAAGDTGLEPLLAAAAKSIAADASETFGGIFAFLSPEIGPAAAGPAAAGYAAVLAMSPGLATGTSFVPHDMLAQIHQGEMVVPRYDADLIRAGAGGGGGHTFNYAPTINGGGPAVERAVRQSAEDFKGYLAQVTRNGQLALPGRPQIR